MVNNNELNVSERLSAVEYHHTRTAATLREIRAGNDLFAEVIDALVTAQKVTENRMETMAERLDQMADSMSLVADALKEMTATIDGGMSDTTQAQQAAAAAVGRATGVAAEVHTAIGKLGNQLSTAMSTLTSHVEATSNAVTSVAAASRTTKEISERTASATGDMRGNVKAIDDKLAKIAQAVGDQGREVERIRTVLKTKINDL